MTQVREVPALGLGDLGRVLKRHPKKSFVTFCALMSLSIAVLILLPRTYESESLLFVRVGRESVTLDPTVTTGQIIALNESRESELNSILEVLKSRAIMERVVDRLGPQAILLPPSEGNSAESSNPLKDSLASAVNTVAQWLEPTGPLSEREKAIQTLSKNAAIYNKQKSNVISVTYKARSPKQAQTIVTALVDEYMSEHQRIHATAGSHSFFMEQETVYREKLDAAQQELTAAKNEMGLASLEGKRQLIEDRIKKITTEQLSVQTSISASSARIASLENLISDLPSRITSQEVDGMPNVAGDNMRQQLYVLEIQEKELLSKYTKEHPLVIAAQQKVLDAKQIMGEQAESRTYATTAVNPAVQKLQVELLVEKAAGEALQARLGNLEHEYIVAQADLKEMNSHELKLNELNRELALAEANYQVYASKLEEARIQQSLDDEHISNLNVSQPATFVEKPVSPKKAIVLVAGLLMSCVGALCMAILAEMNNRVMRSPVEVEDQLGLPVVVTLPAQRRNTVLMN
jgi:polysaccharide biosynthesis protein PslE